MYRTASVTNLLSNILSGPIRPPINVLGAIGSGKSQVIRTIVASSLCETPEVSSIRRIIYDNKGDYAEGLPVADHTLLFLSAKDTRSVYWDIAKDLDNPTSRAAFVSAFVESLHSDKNASTGTSAAETRALSTAIERCYLLRTDWSWVDLVKEVRGHTKGITLSKTEPQDLNILIENLSRIAEEWGSGEGRIRFSLADWYAEKDPKNLPGTAWCPSATNLQGRSTLILVDSKRYETSNRTLFLPFLNVLLNGAPGNLIGAKTWLVIDEMPVFRPTHEIFSALMLSHTRDIQVVCGLQDLTQIETILDSKSMEQFLTEFSTFIICRICRSPCSKTLGYLQSMLAVSKDAILGLGPGQTGVSTLAVSEKERTINSFWWPYCSWVQRRKVSPCARP